MEKIQNNLLPRMLERLQKWQAKSSPVQKETTPREASPSKELDEYSRQELELLKHEHEMSKKR